MNKARVPGDSCDHDFDFPLANLEGNNMMSIYACNYSPKQK